MAVLFVPQPKSKPIASTMASARSAWSSVRFAVVPVRASTKPVSAR